MKELKSIDRYAAGDGLMAYVVALDPPQRSERFTKELLGTDIKMDTHLITFNGGGRTT